MQEYSGRVWRFGKNVDTDVIVPGQYLDAPMEEILPHVLESVNAEFANRVKSGDLLFAGTNFGCGSSREQAPLALKSAGIACVVAESFGRIFFRNAIAIGLPVLICRDVGGAFQNGQQASVLLDQCLVRNLETGVKLVGEPLSEEMAAILEMGGILEYLRRRR